MELSLPDMPFGMRGQCACGRARRRALPSPRCTGEVTFGELVDDFVKRYAAPREKILADVGALLLGLADKRLLVFVIKVARKAVANAAFSGSACCTSLLASSPN